MSLDVISQTVPATTGQTNTYGQILKSTALVGGSSAINIAIGMFRTKALAILLGPAGYGLFGLYGSIANLVQSFASMGVSSSGVRQIAEAVASGDTDRIALTTAVLRRSLIVLAGFGAGLLVVFSRQISQLTFGSRQHAAGISLLSLAVFFQMISWGQNALIQGMRRIVDLAKMQVFGALFGLLISVPMVYFLRQEGVVPALVCVAFMALAVSWWYSRGVGVRIPSVSFYQICHEASALLKLGLVFMTIGFMSMGIGYAVRIMLLRKVGLEATGVYQSAWTLGGLYVGFILQAMAADFYPRLTASAHDNAICNRLVNEQAQVGLLLAGPGVLATLSIAPLVITLFYTAKFGAAVEVLRWISLGTILQVITWPMGLILAVKGRNALYFGAEFVWASTSVGFAYVCVSRWGLNGAGVSFFGSYIVSGFVLYSVVSRISGFRWSNANKRTALVFLPLVILVFTTHYVLPQFWASCLGVGATILGGVYSLRTLSTFVSCHRVPAPLRRLLVPLQAVISRLLKTFAHT